MEGCVREAYDFVGQELWCEQLSWRINGHSKNRRFLELFHFRKEDWPFVQLYNSTSSWLWPLPVMRILPSTDSFMDSLPLDHHPWRKIGRCGGIMLLPYKPTGVMGMSDRVRQLLFPLRECHAGSNLIFFKLTLLQALTAVPFLQCTLACQEVA